MTGMVLNIILYLRSQNPTGPTNVGIRVMRGGAFDWLNVPVDHCRIDYRN